MATDMYTCSSTLKAYWENCVCVCVCVYVSVSVHTHVHESEGRAMHAYVVTI